MNIFKKFFNTQNNNNEDNKNISSYGVNWYSDRYQSAIFYRNIMISITILSMFLTCVSVLVLLKINYSRTLEPFIIEIEKKTGVATLVDQSDVKKFTSDESVSNYFLVKYVTARERFSKHTYSYDWYTTVRDLSQGDIYRRFINFVSDKENQDNPMNLYNTIDILDIKIRSIQYLDNKSAQIRFSLYDASTSIKRLISNKIALISFEYIFDDKMTVEKRYNNPLGFKVISYRVNDEIL